MIREPKRNKLNCLEDLRRRILTEALEPGSYLDETEISEAYGISRPPLRELLRQLAGEGYVILHENRGAQVAPMTHKTLRNFFIAAPMIYAAIGRLAAQNATTAQIMRLKDTQLMFRAAIRDGNTEQRTLTNERFHSIMGEMADNEFLMPSLRRLLIDHARIGMIFYNTRRPELADQRAVAVEQHDQFIRLIEEHDADGCADLAIAHWELSRAQIESFVAPASFFVPLGRVPDSMP
ncbi:GntR family transcriptional regulator [Neorhizobium galegae]|uniref:Transcriptional regulator mdcY family n=1 Tax=Neorhizobium galegae bv. orientalis str. HAMBI 540 TaxID=1028800 RepID=A0A068T0L7_NEOGA|nr:GntR family transcriptional regulator [Neorhizobium galegae]MCQ1854569.1 GntR family transcriptional regulator [Neorhizobium galegae]CDN51923.1 Transcriptional regulator mdcY family [Neorhizobium galegae bv. orientalis str. HAMBI 540]CDZ51578.1 Transcriptional regulator mdcY family [Neorhizobium galegae bv. orientalis]